jgi:hypothetical protein
MHACLALQIERLLFCERFSREYDLIFLVGEALALANLQWVAISLRERAVSHPKSGVSTMILVSLA